LTSEQRTVLTVAGGGQGAAGAAGDLTPEQVKQRTPRLLDGSFPLSYDLTPYYYRMEGCTVGQESAYDKTKGSCPYPPTPEQVKQSMWRLLEGARQFGGPADEGNLVGLGRIVALHHRPSTLLVYRIYKEIQRLRL
jgi:hypothetical protein